MLYEEVIYTLLQCPSSCSTTRTRHHTTDYTDRINVSTSPPYWEESEEGPIAEWAAVRIRKVYPFWGENSITLKPADLKHPFDTPDSRLSPGETGFDRPWKALSKVKSPLEQLRADNAKMESKLRIAIDGMSMNYGMKWKTSVARAAFVSGLQRRLQKILETSGRISGERVGEEWRKHEAVLKGLLEECEVPSSAS